MTSKKATNTTPAAQRNRGARRDSVNQVGDVTRQFFVEGDHAEATQWEDSPLLRNEEDSHVEFRSFDRVPRRRGPLAAVLTSAATIAVGLFVMHDGAARSQRAWRDTPVGLALILLGSGTPTEVPRRQTIDPAPPRSPQISDSPPPPSTIADPSPVAVAAETTLAAESPPPTPPPSASPPSAKDIADTSPTLPERAEMPSAKDMADTSPTLPERAEMRNAAHSPRSSSHHSGGALRGYVWSPDEKRLVPSGLIGASTGI